jgi:hypothetical protein
LENEEEPHRENENKRVRREAALFQRHQSEVTTRMKLLRAKEDARRQAEYLNKSYEERLPQAKDESETTEEEKATGILLKMFSKMNVATTST